MALTGMASATAILDAGARSVVPTSARLSIIDVVSDSTATAANSTELITPLSFTGSSCKWVKVGPNGGRALWRTRYHLSTDMTTSPTIYVIGARSDVDPDPQFALAGTTAKIFRLDNSSGVAGIQLLRVAATDIRDGTNRFTDWKTFTNPFTGVVGDLTGITHLLTLCSVASVGGTGVIEMGLLN